MPALGDPNATGVQTLAFSLCGTMTPLAMSVIPSPGCCPEASGPDSSPSEGEGGRAGGQWGPGQPPCVRVPAPLL